MFKKILTLPKKLTANSLHEIINKSNFVFELRNKESSDFLLNVENIKEVDIIGMLLLYKFIEFSAEKRCFDNPKINNRDDVSINKFIKEYGFGELIKTYINSKDLIKALKNLKIEKTDTFLIAPQALIRESSKSKTNFDITFEKELKSFYKNESTILIESVLFCAVEISSNFYKHAITDTKSIILARGTKSFIEIACADTGDGIISTLRLLEKYQNVTDLKLIKKAFDKGITSKPNSDHMGYGLWLVKEIVKRSNGILLVYSSKTNFSVKFGKEKVMNSPYWGGTIVYLKLHINNIGIDIGGILKESRKKDDLSIKINFQ